MVKLGQLLAVSGKEGHKELANEGRAIVGFSQLYEHCD